MARKLKASTLWRVVKALPPAQWTTLDKAHGQAVAIFGDFGHCRRRNDRGRARWQARGGGVRAGSARRPEPVPFADRQKRYLILTKEFWRDAAITASTTTIAVASPYRRGSRDPWRRSHRSGMPYSRATPTSRDFTASRRPAQTRTTSAGPPIRHCAVVGRRRDMTGSPSTPRSRAAASTPRPWRPTRPDRQSILIDAMLGNGAAINTTKNPRAASSPKPCAASARLCFSSKKAEGKPGAAIRSCSRITGYYRITPDDFFLGGACLDSIAHWRPRHDPCSQAANVDIAQPLSRHPSRDEAGRSADGQDQGHIARQRCRDGRTDPRRSAPMWR